MSSKSTISADDSQGLPKNFYSMLKKLLGTLFDKTFTFHKSDNWQLPASTEYFQENYQIDALQVLKGKLNAVKGKLNDVQIEEWSAHTRRRNPSGEVAWRIKNTIEAEFVTQAWCKFFECLNRFPIVLGPKLNSVHLCEAPGAFIAALNHYLHSNYRDVEWNWLATTLNPYYEGNPLANMVVDDRFMLPTLDNWFFGKDFTGNIMNKMNVDAMAARAGQVGEINLITSDGSIDCMETPECQEEVVSSLHYAETCAALRMLSTGGSFILKMFTLFEATSAALLYLLNCVFDRVSVFKPATSKCGNSEVYVVCVGFRKDVPNFSTVLNALMDHLESSQHSPIFAYESLPDDFIRELESCARFFMHQQILTINRNIVSYKDAGRADGKRSKLIRVHVTNHYMRMYKVRKIPDENKIVYRGNVPIQHYKHSRVYTGSFTERQSLHCKSVAEQLAMLRSNLESLEQTIVWPCEVSSSIISNIDESKRLEIRMYRGKPIERVFSSLFINIHLMHFINKILKVTPDNAKLPIQVSMDAKHITLSSTGLSLNDNYSANERNFFLDLITRIAELQPEIVSIRGLPLLTHFSVSFIGLLVNIFETVTFNASRTIVFEHIQPDGGKEWLERVKDLFKVNNQIEYVLCLVDIKELHMHRLSAIVSNYNNQNCLQYCRVMIDKSSREKDCSFVCF